jgi:hypothetical protein
MIVVERRLLRLRRLAIDSPPCRERWIWRGQRRCLGGTVLRFRVRGRESHDVGWRCRCDCGARIVLLIIARGTGSNRPRGHLFRRGLRGLSWRSPGGGFAGSTGLPLSSSLMMRRMEARISSIETSGVLADCTMAMSPRATARLLSAAPHLAKHLGTRAYDCDRRMKVSTESERRKITRTPMPLSDRPGSARQSRRREPDGSEQSDRRLAWRAPG